MSEFDLIRRFFVRPGAIHETDGVILSIGDDAALLSLPPNTDLAAAVCAPVICWWSPALWAMRERV